jgi:hypothetical protein
MKFFPLLLGLLMLAACQQEKATTPPTEILNEILAAQDAAGLQAKYGQENLSLDTTWFMGDDTLRGSILFPNTPKQAYIYYHHGKIADVSIQGKSSVWKTSSGLFLGMSLTDVQKINNKNFTISGFHWSHGGSVVSWEGGKLSGDSSLSHLASFSNANNMHEGLTDEEYTLISGEAEFDIRHPSIQKLNPRLDLISIIKPFIPSKSEGNKMGHQIEKSQIPPVRGN